MKLVSLRLAHPTHLLISSYPFPKSPHLHLIWLLSTRMLPPHILKLNLATLESKIILTACVLHFRGSQTEGHGPSANYSHVCTLT